ncbi:MAG: carboxypeptidase-like regulatory domain-containing protein [Candidatus Thermoplasmatota archaeon]|nr:carboxypeptidase-like regulatory domain-containing protein [Candidatus Thermoplasmatota archaeon]
MVDTETLTSLPEEETTFKSSGATIILPSQRPLHQRARLAAFLAILAAVAGVYVGLDYLDGDGGIYTHRQMIYAQSTNSPDESASLTGTVVNEDGEPMGNYTITVHTGDHSRKESTYTDSDGRFSFEKLDPGVALLDIDSPDGMHWFRNRVLLTPPSIIEPVGYTHLNLVWPSSEEFDIAEAETGHAWIDLSRSQQENGTEPYDLTAGAVYDMFGTAFTGLGLLSVILVMTGVRQRSVGLIRMGGITSLFSMGHLYISCGLGLLATLLTLFLPVDD